MKGLTSLFQLAATAVLVMVQGCAQHHSLYTPQNSQAHFYGQPGEKGAHFNHEKPAENLYSVARNCTDRKHFAAPLNYSVDNPITLDASISPIFAVNIEENRGAIPLSPGDMVELVLENGDGFNGRYVVDIAGYIKIPMLNPIIAAGLPAYQVAEKIEIALIKSEIFQPATAMVSLQVLQWSDIEISVTGAVFQPGQVMINRFRPSNVLKERTEAFGDYTPSRLLSEALRAASGVRPDAKIDQVILIRKGWQVEVDLTGILSGQSVVEYPLVAGDRIIVPSTGCFQEHLVRPSQITPKGFKVYMSNLTDPAQSNSGAGIERYATNLPYGTRLLQAAISANCIGGKEWTSAPRKIVLASRHPITGEMQVIERSTEQLFRQPHMENINPYLMPNDALACYDSDITNLRDVAKAVVDIISPFKLL